MRASKLTKEDKEALVELYNHGEVSPSALAKSYEVSVTRICQILKQEGVYVLNDLRHRPRKNKDLDRQYLKDINSSRKAYYFGLLMADGHVNLKSAHVELTLQEEDKHILESFREDIGSISQLMLKKPRGNRKPAYRLVICSREWCEQLQVMGLNNHKSEELNWCVIDYVPEKFRRDFIRGFFDGNGSISLSNSDVYVTFTSTINFCTNLQLYLKESLNVNSSLVIHSTNYIRRLDIGGRYTCLRLLDWMYEDATCFLRRKFNKYKKVKDNATYDYLYKLSKEDYVEIKALKGSGLTQGDIAKRFNVSPAHVGRILRGYIPKLRDE